MFTGLAEGTGLGLATGISCLASCGPIYLTYLLSEQRSNKQSTITILLLNVGRFVSYATFGAIMGLLGGSIPSSVRVPLAYSGYLLFSVYLVISVVRVNKTCGGCDIPKWMKFTKSPLLLGILTGFSACPAFLIAVTSAFDTSGALQGAMLFTGFFLGTTVYMLPFAIVGLFNKKQWLNTVAKYAAIFVAVYFSIVGIRGLASYYLQSDEVIIDVNQTVTSDAGNQNDESVGIYNALNQDTLYVLTFPEISADKGTDMFSDLAGAEGPVIVLVQSDSVNYEMVLSTIPNLSAVIGPWWIDYRSEAELSQWQETVNALVAYKNLRLFAVEYEPYDTERAGIIYQYLARYSFRCADDEGFTFLLTSDVGCATDTDCNTCPVNQ